MSDENIFSALEKYTDENYLTEAFVFVINSLLERERSAGIDILTQLCVKNNEFSFEADESISVVTQETTEKGTPDITVSSPDKLIYIEVKDYSRVDPEQLKRYKEALETSNAAIKRLILITRFPVDFSEHKGIPDKQVCWSEVYNWLANARTRAKDPINVYLIDSFKSFLEVKQMSMQKVGWEYINGVPALNNLINMIEVAIQGAGIPIHGKSPGWDFKGFWLKNKEFLCGVYTISNPLVITFELMDKTKYNKELFEDHGYEVREDTKDIWFRLQLEDKLFFALDKDKQVEELTNFVKKGYSNAQQMRLKEE